MTAASSIQEVMAETDVRVAKNLRTLVLSYEITHGQLADIMGKSLSWVQERVSGRTPCKAADLRGFCAAFGIDDIDVMFWEDRFAVLGYVAENPADLGNAPSRWTAVTAAQTLVVA